MRIVQIGPEDRDELERFACAGSGRFWAREIEDAVRYRLADQLDHPDNAVVAVGLVDQSGRICAIAAGSLHPEDPETWQCHLVAVRDGLKRCGHGRRAKEALLDRSRSAGASVAVSFVHRENESMLLLNRALGARTAHDPSSADYLICTIVL